MTAVDSRVDLYLGGDWVTTTNVRQNPPIQIVAGAKDEDTEASPSRCTFELDDPDGDYDPGNPMGTWFGDLKENTRVRVGVPLYDDDFDRTVANGWGGDWVNGAGSGGTVAASDWSVSGGRARHSVPVASAFRTSDLPGRLFINSEVRFTVTLPVADIAGGLAATIVKLRTVDASNYLGVQVVFHTTDSVQIGVFESIAGVARRLLADTRVLPNGTTLTDQAFRVAMLVEGQVVRGKVWPVGDPEPLDWQVTCTRATVREGYVGVVSVVDAGNSNPKPFVLAYDDLEVGVPCFHGEIAEFTPGVADESHAAPFVEITASGIGRRVEQGSEPLKSSMFRAWSSTQRWVREGAAESEAAVGDVNTLTAADADAADVAVGNQFRLLDAYGRHKEDTIFTVTAKASAFGFTNIDFTPDALQPVELGDLLASWRNATADDLPIAYWPCEEEKNATTISSGLPGGAPLGIRVGTPKFAELDSFASSLPLPKLNNAELYAQVPDYTDVNEAFTTHFLVHFPAADEAASGTNFVQFTTQGGTAEVWALIYAGSGNLRINAIDTNTGTVLFDNIWAFGMQDLPAGITLNLDQATASTVTYHLFVNGLSTGDVTATGVTRLGKITTVRVNPNGGYIETGFGHLSVTPKQLTDFNLRDQREAYANENLPRRLVRLAYEEGEPLVYCQGPVAADTLGAQQQDTLLANWQQAVDFDLGRFYESKGAYSFEYRSRASLCNQTPILDLDYEGGAVLAVLTPTRDDQASRNDVTVKREGGSSARHTKETGPKSVAEIGRYTDAPTLNAANDDQLADLAAWRVHLGTVAEDRYPTVKVTTANGALSLERMLSVGVGDRVRLTNAGARRRYEPIDQLVPGYTLTLHRYVPVLEMNCIPASPYQVAVLDLAGVRLDSDSTVLNQAITNSTTTFDVFTSSVGTTWTVDPADFPFDVLIGGERVTVTGITGAGWTVQTFTVTRAVNGVSRAWPAGTKVSLADPYYLPL